MPEKAYGTQKLAAGGRGNAAYQPGETKSAKYYGTAFLQIALAAETGLFHKKQDCTGFLLWF